MYCTYIRGGPYVTGSRECDCIGEVGNERDIVSQTLLKGEQNSVLVSIHTQCMQAHNELLVPSFAVFCWHQGLGSAQLVGSEPSQTVTQTHDVH